MSVVIALDQGSTNTKAVAVDVSGAVVASASLPLRTRTPRPGEVEHDARELWNGALEVLVSCVEQVGADQVAGYALANQRESVVAWRRSDSAPAGPVLGWQDVRGGAGLMVAERDLASVEQRTGLRCDPMYSAPKMRWLLDRADGDPAAHDVVVGTVDAWLLWNLTGGAELVTEAGNASRTLLLDLDEVAWSAELLEVFGIAERQLPRVVASDGPFGTAAADPLPSAPVLAVLADSHAALAAHGDAIGDAVKVTYGTGSSLMRPRATSERAPAGLATTLSWVRDGRPVYAWEGNIRYSAAVLDWASRMVGARDVDHLLELAGSVPDSDGVDVVPAFGGLGAPHWDPDAVGVVSGLSAGSGPAHLARAAVDAVALQVDDVLAAMRPGAGTAPLLADGGATRSALVMQTQANLSDVPVRTAGPAPLAAVGAARVAAARLGWPAPEPPCERRHDPDPAWPRADRRRRWRDALARSRLVPAADVSTPDLSTTDRLHDDPRS